MNYLKNVFVVSICFLAVLLDVSFFSNLPIYGVTLITSFLLILLVTNINKKNTFLIFGLAISIFFTIFSSISIFAIISNFLFVPAIFIYLKDRYVPETNSFLTLVYCFLASFFFILCLMIEQASFTEEAVSIAGYFVLVHGIMSFILIVIANSVSKKLKSGEIKF